MAIANAQIGIAKAGLLSFARSLWPGWLELRGDFPIAQRRKRFLGRGRNLAQDIFYRRRPPRADASSPRRVTTLPSPTYAAPSQRFPEVAGQHHRAAGLDAARQSQTDAVDSSRRQLEIATSRYTGGLALSRRRQRPAKSFSITSRKPPSSRASASSPPCSW